MNHRIRLGSISALVLPLLLSGCSYLVPTKRRLPVPKAPAVVQTATPEELVKLVNERWNGFKTLTATVQIQATELKSAEGIEKDFPSCRGFILMSKPKQLRVVGTYFGVKIFDMASDGNHFTLVMPTKNTVIRGANTVTEKSKNQLENLRPDFFLDALTVRALDPDNEYMVTGDSETMEDAAKKHLYLEPEYVLSVMRRKTANENLPVRVITFHRDNMLPYDQDVYDSKGNPETQITYRNYSQFSAGEYPTTITIKRPQEGIQLVLTVERVQKNVNLPPDQFDVKAPEGATIHELK